MLFSRTELALSLPRAKERLMLDQALIVKLCIVQHNKDTNNTSLALQSSWEVSAVPPCSARHCMMISQAGNQSSSCYGSDWSSSKWIIKASKIPGISLYLYLGWSLSGSIWWLPAVSLTVCFWPQDKSCPLSQWNVAASYGTDWRYHHNYWPAVSSSALQLTISHNTQTLTLASCVPLENVTFYFSVSLLSRNTMHITFSLPRK